MQLLSTPQLALISALALADIHRHTVILSTPSSEDTHTLPAKPPPPCCSAPNPLILPDSLSWQFCSPNTGIGSLAEEVGREA